MILRLLGLCTCVTLLAGSATGCGVLTPGNEGWRCEKSKDCKDGLRCRTYKFKGQSTYKKFCTGKKALSTSKQTYGWFVLIAGWVMIIGLPLLVVVAVVVGRLKKKKAGAAPGGDGTGGAAPGGDAAPPDDASRA